jgi:hypothetical protein
VLCRRLLSPFVLTRLMLILSIFLGRRDDNLAPSMPMPDQPFKHCKNRRDQR